MVLLLKTESCILIFDYWLGPNEILPEMMAKDKPIYVFSSYFHEDNFTNEILSWKDKFPKNRVTDIELLTAYSTGNNDKTIS